MKTWSLRKNKSGRNRTWKNYMNNTRTHSRKSSKKSKKHIVLIHSNHCHHCTTLLEIWNSVKSNARYNTIYTDIEANTMRNQVTAFENKYHMKIVGYPTIMKIKNNVVNTYNGDRSKESLVKWILR